MPERSVVEIHNWYELAEELRHSHQGLNVEDMMRLSGRSRSTVNRWLERVEQQLFDHFRLDKVRHRGRVCYRLVPDRPLQRRGFEMDPLFRLNETSLFDLKVAIDFLRSCNMDPKAERLEELKSLLESIMRRDDADRYQDALPRITGSVAVALPPARPIQLDRRVSDTINTACLKKEALRISYENGATYEVHPLGYVYGPGTHYLIVAGAPSGSIFRLRLDRIQDAHLLGHLPGRPQNFDLDAHVNNAFSGLFDGETINVVLGFSPDSAEEARRIQFHANQLIEDTGDGRIIVRFTASGELAICHYLFSWGEDVEILEPVSLRERYKALLDGVRSVYAGDSRQ